MYYKSINYKPTKKVSAGGIGGALTVIVIYMMSLNDIPITGEVGAAIAVIIGFGVSWLTEES